MSTAPLASISPVTIKSSLTVVSEVVDPIDIGAPLTVPTFIG